MILIADSGSTKTDWRVIDEAGKISQAKTVGLNPYLETKEKIAAVLREELYPQLNTSIHEVHFYGAGCTTPSACALISEAIKTVFQEVKVAVNSDLLGAARALCGTEAGIACILGTGSNTCLYDGKEIIDNIPPMGYIIGDEGSGSNIGKELINRYFRRELPPGIKEKLEKRFDMSKESVLENVMRQPYPNRYMAGFAKFVFQNLKEPYLMQMVYSILANFFDKTIAHYDNYQQYKIHFTGSIAFYFGNLLRQVANDKGLRVFNILESPIAGLTLYHQEILKS
ncbi:N-acetylglucosamine kinase [Catalinimonas niigatensis]|uniref:N-acetylglucosamine kinase n=1 Tax=Catalinimonas niigatensis TaxID=1397264 RepID=UPI00266594A8|nr:N-acetylglucosamine kinase [Catalinimonas niigatensis]WPP49406.1 N-acetylglucosamine kinase [Catalinimonas niigatensis]